MSRADEGLPSEGGVQGGAFKKGKRDIRSDRRERERERERERASAIAKQLAS